ncbi:MAG: hypothetical protein ACK5UE_09690 [Chitinophagales bacterium]|jgi:hypothetical protein|nr:hypothetical protein [Sphingobacteriales bacterium]
MKIVGIVFIIFSLTNSCNEKATDLPKIKIANSLDNFAVAFSKDSIQQFNYLEFPIVNLQYDIDKNKYDTFEIKVKDWQYTNLSDKKGGYLINYKGVTKSNFIMEIMVKETGVLVEYHFRKVKNVWKLYLIIDNST